MDQARIADSPTSSGAEPDFAITLSDVHVAYDDGSGGKKTVLNDIDLRIRKGEFTTLVGPSGSGKSTLFRLVLGAEQPTVGRVLIGGEPLPRPNRHCGIVYQRYSLFPHFTVAENVSLGLELQEYSLLSRLLQFRSYRQRRAELHQQARDYLDRVGLADSGDKYPHQLSGGMCQRVAILQALISGPKILLMDEPFGALDDSTRQDMQLFMLERWKETGMTVLFVTHDLPEALFLGSRVLVLSPYYSTDDPKSCGSKIVKDTSVPGGHPKPTEFKYGREFARLVEEIRHEGLDPEYRQHIGTFDLTHRDSFRTVETNEMSR